jgi:hypothetical protein
MLELLFGDKPMELWLVICSVISILHKVNYLWLTFLQHLVYVVNYSSVAFERL